MLSKTTLVLAGLVAGAALWFGHARFEAGLASGRSELTAYKLEVAEQRTRDAGAAHRRYQAKVDELAAASARLDQLQQDLDNIRAQLTRRIPHAAQPPKPVAGQPSPGLLSVDGLQLYNAAFGLQAGYGTAGTDQPDQEDPAAGAADSGVSREDLLAHSRDLGLWCRAVAAQRDELIDLLPKESQP
ncbi:hypothetical protein [Pseudogulbenkiania ferrooxidans]|uniref:Uncharacterized protein n=1 Tax=Pseudogulbenkiania ferrooxidans 2002 TaxID=279714 RepID=B9Z502_9NEIS|nr:hypothetical protein [Pseudogulbenkiania ferrooxidans]EEG08234.1 conserved hypothetical protein [Pseudogulbenkiania ferrooxidans 2002]